MQTLLCMQCGITVNGPFRRDPLRRAENMPVIDAFIDEISRPLELHDGDVAFDLVVTQPAWRYLSQVPEEREPIAENAG